ALAEGARPQLGRRGGNGGGGNGGGQRGGQGQGRGQGRGQGFGIGTAFYDSVFLATDEILKKPEGRKAIILLTDGVDYGSKTSLIAAIESSQRADTLAYPIRFFDSSMQQRPSSPVTLGRGGGGGRRGRGGVGFPGGGG